MKNPSSDHLRKPKSLALAGAGRRRESAQRNKKYRTQAWKRTKNHQLEISPYCEICGAIATIVDHFKGHGPNWEAEFFKPENLRSLCAPCHAKQEDSKTPYAYRPRG